MLLGILLVLGGLAWIMAYVYVPDFLYGAGLSGLWGLFAPFLLIFLGAILIFAGITDTKREGHSKIWRKLPPPPPPPP